MNEKYLSNNKYSKNDIIFHVVLSVSATIFIMIFAKSTGFLQREFYGNDSTIFMYIGRAVKYGYIPYKDIYDIKGPLLWLIEYLGQVIYEGRYGIHLLEIINYNVIVFLTYRTAREYSDEIRSFVLTVIMFVFWSATIDVGNTVEEFSYLFSMTAVYFTVRSIRNRNRFLSRKLYIIYGITAMCATLIRLTDCVITGGCIIYAMIIVFRECGLNKVLSRIALVAASAVCVLIPFVIYFSVNNSIDEWIDASLLFSYKYSVFNKASMELKTIAPLIAVLCIGLYKIFTGEKEIAFLSIITTVLCIVLYAAIGTKYFHYMLVSGPCILLMGILVIGIMKKRGVLFRLLFIIVFTGLSFRYVHMSYLNVYKALFVQEINSSIDFAENIKKIINNESADSVYIYDTDEAIIFRNNYFSDSKYFSSQIQWSQNSDMMQKIYDDFAERNSKWVITHEYSLEYGDFRIAELIDENYDLIYSEDSYILYKRH